MRMLLPFFVGIPIFHAILCVLIRRSTFCRILSRWTPILTTVMVLVLGLEWIANPNTNLRYFFGGWPPPFGIEFRLDLLSLSFLFLVNSIFALVFSSKVTDGLFNEERQPQYSFFLFQTLLAGLNGMVLTGDLFNLYVFLEIAALSAYALIAWGGAKASFASFRYLLLGTVGGCFYLMGLGFLYAKTGTLNMEDMMAHLQGLSQSNAALIALSFMVVGVALKVGLFPMHGWLPDVYTYAPSAVSAILSSTMSKVNVYVLVRLLFSVFPAFAFIADYLYAILILSAFGILFGSVMAIAQQDFRRMLAYSSVGQMGSILMAFSLATPSAMAGAILYSLCHGYSKAALFLFAHEMKVVSKNSEISSIVDYRNFSWTFRILFVVSSLSMIGIPPLGGFFAKYYVALGAYEAGFLWISVLVVFSGLLTAAYFYRMYEGLFFVRPDSTEQKVRPSSNWSLSEILFCVVLFGLGLANSFLTEKFLMKVYASLRNFL